MGGAVWVDTLSLAVQTTMKYLQAIESASTRVLAVRPLCGYHSVHPIERKATHFSTAGKPELTQRMECAPAFQCPLTVFIHWRHNQSLFGKRLQFIPHIDIFF